MVQKGLLPEREAQALQDKANEAGLSFVEHLVAAKRFNETEVAEFAAHTFGFPLVDLNAFDPDHLPAKLIDARALQSPPGAAAVPARQSRVRGDLGSDQPGRDGPDQVPDRPARRARGGRGRQARQS